MEFKYWLLIATLIAIAFAIVLPHVYDWLLKMWRS